MTKPPVARIVAVQLRDAVIGPPDCIGRVLIVCPYCQDRHSHRVFNNDPTVFTRIAPCTGDPQESCAPMLKYRIDLDPKPGPAPNRERHAK